MAIIPCNQLSLADIFSDCQDIYESDKPAFLSLLQSNIDLDEIIPDSFGIISMHQRDEPVNTLCMPFYGHLLFSGFFQSLLTHYFLYFSIIPDTFANSVVSTKFLMPLKLRGLNKISSAIFNYFLKNLQISLSLFVNLSMLKRQP